MLNDDGPYRCRVLLEALYSLAETDAEIVNLLHCQIRSVTQYKEILGTGLIVEGQDASLFKLRCKLVFRPGHAALLISPSLFGTAAWTVDKDYAAIGFRKYDLKERALHTRCLFAQDLPRYESQSWYSLFWFLGMLVLRWE
jgi:hypothetical protein